MRLLRWLGYLATIAASVVLTIVLVYAVQARLRLPELRDWHTVRLNDFRAGRAASFDEYRALEERLFAELEERVMSDSQTFGRYNPKSVVARIALDTKYNRSYELVPPGEPSGAALLVHGLSDSPYSVRALAETFAARGYYVLALRLPGHGTAPTALVDVTWQDWYAAVVLAARHAAAKAGPGKPFVAGGHSTGAALLTLYALRSLADRALPRPQRLYLLSPAIGISPFAALTRVVSALAFIPAFEKSRWLDVLPEYDPFKYNSFPVNAARQIHALTQEVQRTMDSEPRLAEMPRVIAFQSIVDSTVTARKLVAGLFARLPAAGHELVVFDINRGESLEGWIAPGPLEDFEKLRSAPALPFRLTLVANRARDTRSMAAYTRQAGAREVAVENLPYEWPAGVYSVGHVSLPFPVDDPVYGLAPAAGVNALFNLGSLVPRGEAGALLVSPGTFERLRSNPFWGVIAAKVVAEEEAARRAH